MIFRDMIVTAKMAAFPAAVTKSKPSRSDTRLAWTARPTKTVTKSVPPFAATVTEPMPCLSGCFSQVFKADVLIEMRSSPFGIIAGTAIHQHDEPLGINIT